MTLFGGIDRTTKVAFAVSVHKRDAATLIALFQKKHRKFSRIWRKTIILHIFKLTINTILLAPKIPTSILRKLALMARTETHG